MRFLSMQVKPWRVGILFLLGIMLIAGWLWVTRPPYAKLKHNMTMAEVEDIMGKPLSVLGNGQSTEWHYYFHDSTGNNPVTLFFDEGRLVRATGAKGGTFWSVDVGGLNGSQCD